MWSAHCGYVETVDAEFRQKSSCVPRQVGVRGRSVDIHKWQRIGQRQGAQLSIESPRSGHFARPWQAWVHSGRLESGDKRCRGAEGGKGLGVCAFLFRCRVQDAGAGHVEAIPASIKYGVHGIDPGETQWWIFTLDAP